MIILKKFSVRLHFLIWIIIVILPATIILMLQKPETYNILTGVIIIIIATGSLILLGFKKTPVIFIERVPKNVFFYEDIPVLVVDTLEDGKLSCISSLNGSHELKREELSIMSIYEFYALREPYFKAQAYLEDPNAIRKYYIPIRWRK